ncbi:hypothetical protein HMPREF3222_00361 [Clostridium perfringens]|uniref:Uncharacterized protein n=1 Tax=Clostridium perfringens TaxID=1502 RepID=A0A133NDN7_CLOPF|nr:hypothetical protein HMPREF3222_00361 [Clostridium perfringens]
MFAKLLIYTFLLLELSCKLRWLFLSNSIENFKGVINDFVLKYNIKFK